MAIPDFQSIMLPLLKYLKDNQEHNIRGAIEYICSEFELIDQDKQELLLSGQPIIDNRVGWAKTYMLKAGLIQSTRRGFFKITQRGREVLNENPHEINTLFLKRYPEFVDFHANKKEQTTEKSKESDESEKQIENLTPDDLMEKGFKIIKDNLKQQLLINLRNIDPYFFENIVLELLSKMGYGKGEVTKKSRDEGVDGFINQDKLGIDKIYFQAKRFGEDVPVSSEMVHRFIGALTLKGVSKGVFITTSRFTKDAENINPHSMKIILIDGQKLAELMMDYNLGVSTTKTYEIKRIDSDYFIEE